MRLLTAVLAGLLVGGVFAGSIWAARIVGTSKNDTLRGTSASDSISGGGGADKIYGLGGNDTLSGGPGNDVISGGPGADKVTCGPGRDRVVVDARDRVSLDCELRGGSTKPPPPPPPPPPAQAGKYSGTTSQNERITFEVLGDGRTVAAFSIAFVNHSCTPSASLYGPLNLGSTTIPIAADGSLALNTEFSGSVSGFVSFHKLAVAGRFTGAIAAGTLKYDTTFSAQGVSYTCTAGNVSWTASRTG
jgi:hypothetical protein